MTEDKDQLIALLLEKTKTLESAVSTLNERLEDNEKRNTTYYASQLARQSESELQDIPDRGYPAKFVASMIEDLHMSDFNPKLNTSSYVNVVSEEEERHVAAMGAEINIADAAVYPGSIEIHDKTVNMIARMWNAPKPKNGGNYCGAGTVGSTEACLLAGLAHKFRWRRWYGEKHGLNEAEVVAVRPNLVIGTHFQAAWEKLFRYFDIEPRMVKANLIDDKMSVNAKELVALCDDKTIAVVGILGNHYNGMYDPISEIDREVSKLNAEKGYQVAIHCDAASGGFIAPFEEMSGLPTVPFDFRLPNVLSMSASGHKFGESICGTGWVIFRQREDLAEHIAVTVTYLGGTSDSLTLNFSRPASGPYVQFYKLLRLGKQGYMSKVRNQMDVAAYIRRFLASQVHEPSGKKRFQMLDGGDTNCLPVVAARINPELNLHYNDIDMQHALSESHWYVSGYSLGFNNPLNEKFEALFSDVCEECTMFRIVVKSNLTLGLAENLTGYIEKTLVTLDAMDGKYEAMRFKHYKCGKEDDVPILHGKKLMADLVKSDEFHSLVQRSKAKNSIVTQAIC